MPCRVNPDEIMRAFEANARHLSTDREALRLFVDRHFLPPGADLNDHTPSDYQLQPNTLMRIADPQYRAWALHLNATWKELCRKVNPRVHLQESRYSQLYMPESFIIPGGRFRELYYWDSYWTIKGLLASEMYETARCQILNMIYLVLRYGFVPNGGRTYYLNRSQPPMLSAMVASYMRASGDLSFVRAVLPALDREYSFWRRFRRVLFTSRVTGRSHSLYHYCVSARHPRPEAYREDVAAVEHLTTNAERFRLYSHIASACESGWDFSSRWMTAGAPHTMRHVRTCCVAPVDLNAYMHWNARHLAELHRRVDDHSLAKRLDADADHSEDALNTVFWQPHKGCWLDIDLETSLPVDSYFASNLLPLFTFKHLKTHVISAVLDYIQDSNILTRYPHGLPISDTRSGQQWDHPNGWSPITHMIVTGLKRTGHPAAVRLSLSLARRWLECNYLLYRRTGGQMYEKYNMESSVVGGGGEYDVQTGFGWTNAVVLDLLVQFGDQLRAPTDAIA